MSGQDVVADTLFLPNLLIICDVELRCLVPKLLQTSFSLSLGLQRSNNFQKASKGPAFLGQARLGKGTLPPNQETLRLTVGAPSRSLARSTDAIAGLARRARSVASLASSLRPS